MSGKYTQAGKLTREYIAKFPSASVRTITQKLMQDHPMVFSDYESARNNVRYHSGLVKDGMGRKIKDPVKRQAFLFMNKYFCSYFKYSCDERIRICLDNLTCLAFHRLQ